jgi:hypothetical protein
VFLQTSSLTSITVNQPNQNYKDISGVLFNIDGTNLIQYPISNTRTSYEIPASVTDIGDYAFQGASSLTSVSIPSSVTSIGLNAFQGATALVSVTFASGSQLTSIGSGAFQSASSLTSITIPSSVTSIGQGAFQGTTNLTTVYIANGQLGITSPAENVSFYGATVNTMIPQ